MANRRFWNFPAATEIEHDGHNAATGVINTLADRSMHKPAHYLEFILKRPIATEVRRKSNHIGTFLEPGTSCSGNL